MENKPLSSPSSKGSSSKVFMKKIINPVVTLILHSPLRFLLSDSVLLVTYRGRKTGKEYTIPVQYAQAGNDIYIVPGNPEQKNWWRNLKEATTVKLVLRGQTLAGTAVVLIPETDSEAILAGFGVYLRRFPALIKYHHIRVEAGGSLNAGDLQRAAKNAVMIRVELS